MKSYDELKAEMEAIQQQMVEAKKNERANALKEVKRLCKEFGFTAGMLKGSLAKGRGEKWDYEIVFWKARLGMSENSPYDVSALRKEFTILEKQINGYPLVYLDSAASAQKPRAVIEAQREFESHFHSNWFLKKY